MLQADMLAIDRLPFCVGRRPGDVCWPAPVWGNLTGGREWKRGELEEFRGRFEASP